jgi:hypothetical protein
LGHAAWATSISSTICQTSSGVQIAPTKGSCSTDCFSNSTSPVIAAFMPMRCTFTLAMQVAAQASGRVMPSTMLIPNRSTKPGLSIMQSSGKLRMMPPFLTLKCPR